MQTQLLKKLHTIIFKNQSMEKWYKHCLSVLLFSFISYFLLLIRDINTHRQCSPLFGFIVFKLRPKHIEQNLLQIVLLTKIFNPNL
jgi:hypothetical protein